MNDANYWLELAKQAPALTVLTVLVIYFLKYLEKIDARHAAAMTFAVQTCENGIKLLKAESDALVREGHQIQKELHITIKENNEVTVLAERTLEKVLKKLDK